MGEAMYVTANREGWPKPEPLYLIADIFKQWKQLV